MVAVGGDMLIAMYYGMAAQDGVWGNRLQQTPHQTAGWLESGHEAVRQNSHFQPFVVRLLLVYYSALAVSGRPFRPSF
jgi:hypothetical protein